MLFRSQPFTIKYEEEIEEQESIVVVVYSNTFSDVQMIRKTLEKYWGKMKVVFVGLQTSEFETKTHYGKNIKRIFPKKNHMRIITNQPRVTYDYFDEWKEEEMNMWIEKVMKEEIQPTKRGSKIVFLDSSVKELTTETFEKFLLEEKDRCLFVYDEEKGKVFSHFSQIVNGFSSVSTIEFGMIDLSTEDVFIDVSVEYLPTILFYPKYSQEPIEIYKMSSVKETISYLQSVATSDLSSFTYGNPFSYEGKKEEYSLEHYEQEIKEKEKRNRKDEL